MKIFKNKELLFGIVTLMVVLFTYWGIKFLKGVNMFSTSKTYYTTYNNVANLKPSNIVTLNGYKIGIVKNIEFSKKEKYRQMLLVTIQIDEPIDIPTDSRFVITSNSLISEMSLRLEYGDSSEMASSRDFIEGSLDVGIMELINTKFKSFEEKIKTTLGSVDTVVQGMGKVLQTKNRASLEEILYQTAISTHQLNLALTSINTNILSQNDVLKKTLVNIFKATENFRKIADSMALISWAKIGKNTEQVSKDLSTILNKMTSDSSSMGLLLNKPYMHQEMLRTSKETRELIRDIKLNPKRYFSISIFGGDESKPYDTTMYQTKK